MRCCIRRYRLSALHLKAKKPHYLRLFSLAMQANVAIQLLFPVQLQLLTQHHRRCKANRRVTSSEVVVLLFSIRICVPYLAVIRMR
ncbi:MAG: hypothetical protein ACI8SJ_002590 [Shewanella sp.]|jgi:hypothetical protein